MFQLNDEQLELISVENGDRAFALEQQIETGRLQQEVLRLRARVKELNVYRFMAYRDDLTGLHNRRYFHERLRDECARVARFSDYEFALIMVDINDFKQVNDTYGHSAGDALLCEAARILNETLRRVDICCRLGGDEFAVILPETNEEGAKHMIERLDERLSKEKYDRPYELSLSLGFACTTDHAPEPSNILCSADEAMYAAKREYKAAKQKQSLSRTG
jgi:diguanylate cyclase (GGDEF)-like protein